MIPGSPFLKQIRLTTDEGLYQFVFHLKQIEIICTFFYYDFVSSPNKPGIAKPQQGMGDWIIILRKWNLLVTKLRI